MTEALYTPDYSSLTVDVVALCIIVVAILCVGYGYLTLKSGYHVDELYTFGLANSYYEPFLTYAHDGMGVTSTSNTYQNYLTATDNPFSYGSVIYNQVQDVHPALYYLIIHTLCSIMPSASMSAIGFIVNAVFIILTIIGLFIWILRKFSRPMAYAVTLCYGFSMGLFSMFVFFRMYSMFTFFAFLATAIFYEFYSNPDARCFKGLALVLCLGGLTHYYFFVYVFFAALMLAVFLIVEKRYLQFRDVAIATGASACIYYGIWGNVIISHLLGYRGEEAFSSVVSTTGTLEKLKEYLNIVLGQISPNMIISVCLLALFLVLIISTIVIGARDKAKRVLINQCLLLTVPWLLYFLLVSKIAPYQGSRYIFNILPLVWVSFWNVFYSVIPAKRVRSVTSAGIVLVSILTSLLLGTPNYMYLDTADTAEYLSSLDQDTVCVYYQSPDYNLPLSCADYFMNYQKIYLVDADSLEWLESENVESSNGKIVLMAESDENLEELLRILGYSTAEEIGEYNYVTVYELSE